MEILIPTQLDVLAKRGQVSSFADLETLLWEFEQALKRHGVDIKPGSQLESAACSVMEVLHRHNIASIRNRHEDIRHVFSEVLGIWIFMKKTVRLQNHPSFATFTPHLHLLNKGTVSQNKQLFASQDATNKIFELLFALVLLDLSQEVALADPDLEDTSNPDILATINGSRWGFACKVVYGASGKTMFDNLKKAVEQIETSSATVGCPVVNFRNHIEHRVFWPLVNEAEYRAGAEPEFGASIDTRSAGSALCGQVTRKRDQVVEEIDLHNVINLYAGKKALPGFLAFCQTCGGQITAAGPVPASITALVLGTFASPEFRPWMPLLEQINEALHERAYSPE